MKPLIALLYSCVGCSLASSIESLLKSGQLYLPVDADLSGGYLRFENRNVLESFGFQPGVDTVNPAKFKQLFWTSDAQSLLTETVPENLFCTSIIINLANKANNDEPATNDQIFSYLNGPVQEKIEEIAGIEILKNQTTFAVKFVGAKELMEEVTVSIRSKISAEPFKCSIIVVGVIKYQVDLLKTDVNEKQTEIRLNGSKLIKAGNKTISSALLRLKSLPIFSFNGIKVIFLDSNAASESDNYDSAFNYSVSKDAIILLISRLLGYRNYDGDVLEFPLDCGSGSVIALGFDVSKTGGAMMKILFKSDSKPLHRKEAMNLLMRSLRVDITASKPIHTPIDLPVSLRFSRTGQSYDVLSMEDLLRVSQTKRFPKDIKSSTFYLDLSSNLPPNNAPYQIGFMAEFPYDPVLKMRLLHFSIDFLAVKKTPIVDILYRVCLKPSEKDDQKMEYWWILNDSRFSWYDPAKDAVEIPRYFTVMESLLWGLMVPAFQLKIVGVDALRMSKSISIACSSLSPDGSKPLKLIYDQEDRNLFLKMARLNSLLHPSHKIETQILDHFTDYHESLLNPMNRVEVLQELKALKKPAGNVDVKVDPPALKPEGEHRTSSLKLADINTKLYRVQYREGPHFRYLVEVKLDLDLSLSIFHDFFLKLAIECKSYNCVGEIKISVRDGLRIFSDSADDLKAIGSLVKDLLRQLPISQSTSISFHKILNI